jgi:hypothetical protein
MKTVGNGSDEGRDEGRVTKGMKTVGNGRRA